MAWDLSPQNLVGVAAGMAILAVGVFVLVARPRSWLHRFFFLLALADGASTLLLRFVPVAPTPEGALLAFANYWYYYIVFVGLLAGFAIVFPQPPVKAWVRWAALAAVGGWTILMLALYVVDHGLFASATLGATGRLALEANVAGNVTNVAVVAITAFIAWKLSRDIRSTVSASHRRQSAYVLGGMVLAYAPSPAVFLIQVLTTRPEMLVTGRLDSALAYWSFAVLLAVLAASAVLLARVREPDRLHDARFVLAAYAGVLLLALLAFVFRDPVVAATLRAVGLLAYPILLGYAIARFEVFDIDRQMRRAATVTIVATGLAFTFILAENAAEGFLAARISLGVSSQFVSGSVAAIVTALLFVPLTRSARKAAQRIVPELTVDELHARKLEVYRHSLAGALADGLMAERESRTLQALRDALGITPQEHARLLEEVLSAAPAPASAPAPAAA